MELIRCLFLALLSCLVFSTIPASADLVLDHDGHPVISGLPYYIRAAQVRNDGNLGWVSTDDSCPMNVRLQSYPYGPAVIFFPEEEESRQNKSILLTEKLSIMFDAPSTCPESTLWKLDRTVSEFVTTGGVKPLPTETSSSSRFRIVRYPFPGVNVYQFMFCPDLDVNMLCMTIGLVGNTMLLGGSTDPMALRFIKATQDQARFKHA